VLLGEEGRGEIQGKCVERTQLEGGGIGVRFGETPTMSRGALDNRLGLGGLRSTGIGGGSGDLVGRGVGASKDFLLDVLVPVKLYLKSGLSGNDGGWAGVDELGGGGGEMGGKRLVWGCSSWFYWGGGGVLCKRKKGGEQRGGNGCRCTKRKKVLLRHLDGPGVTGWGRVTA